jgi:MFS family permease
MDTVGAFLGPLLALLLLSQFHTPYRTVFLIAFIPALAGLAALILVRPSSGRMERPHASLPPSAGAASGPHSVISPDLRRFLFVVGLFALGNSSDVFLLLRAKDLGFSQTLVILVYAFYNLVHAGAAVPAGWLSDRLGRRGVIVGGFCTFAVVYVGFALAPRAALVWPLFALYGFYGAAAEGVAKAYVADLSSPQNRGTAMGLLQTVQGLMAFAASLAAGALWSHVGPSAPFLYGATCALAAAGLFSVVGGRHARPRGR